MGAAEPTPTPAHEVALLLTVTAPEAETALAVAATARVALLHAPYEGQLSTGGNVALPISPSELDAGPVCAFRAYHLIPADPRAPFPVEVVSA